MLKSKVKTIQFNNMVHAISEWQFNHGSYAKRKGHCLQCVRDCLKLANLVLPWNAPPNNGAIDCAKDLKPNPEKYGWKAIHALDQLCVVFFRDTGKTNGFEYGHIGIYDPVTQIIYSSVNYNYSEYWNDRIYLAVIPK